MPKPRHHRPAAPVQALWRTFLTAHAAVLQPIAQGLRDAGVLTIERYDLLLAVYEADDRRIRLADLADRMLFTPGGITRLAGKLQRAGLLRIQPSPTDGRSKLAMLTPRGLSALRRTWAVYEGLIDTHFATAVEADHVAVLQSFLDRLATTGQRGSHVPLTVRGKPPRPPRDGRQ